MTKGKTVSVKKELFCLDADGVLIDMATTWCKWILERFGKVVTPNEVKHWGLAESFGIHEDNLSNLWDYTYTHPNVLYPLGSEFISTLRAGGFDLRVVSARSRALPQARKDLVSLGLLEKEITFVNSPQDKPKVLVALGAKWMVEDCLVNAIQIGCETTINSILLDRPWNQSLDIAPPYKRALSYIDILNKVKELRVKEEDWNKAHKPIR